MLPVKTGIPPNNDGTFMKTSAMESQENWSDLGWYQTLRLVNLERILARNKKPKFNKFLQCLLTAFMDRFRNFREFFFSDFYSTFLGDCRNEGKISIAFTF